MPGFRSKGSAIQGRHAQKVQLTARLWGLAEEWVWLQLTANARGWRRLAVKARGWRRLAVKKKGWWRRLAIKTSGWWRLAVKAMGWRQLLAVKTRGRWRRLAVKVKSACTYKQKFKKSCFGPEYSSDNSGDGPEKRVLWDVFQILRILSAHDWKIAIEIAVSHWDSRTAMDQLNLLDDAITDATEIGILEGSTVHCDECEVMRWINTGTHLPNPWFCPSCLYFKDVSLYGTQLEPSPLGKTFLFDVVRSNATLVHAEIIMKTMAVWEEDDESESDDSEYESEVQYLAYDFDEEVRRRVLAREKDEDVEEEVKKHAHVEVSENDEEGEEDDVEPYDFEAELRKRSLELAEEGEFF